MTNRIFWMTAATAVLLSCNHAAEEDFREELPKDALTSIDAYFAEAPLVKTSYAIGDTDAVFSWSDNDNIDVSVYSSADDIRSYVVFKRVDGGVDDTTVDDSNRATSFTDGQDGNRTFKSLGANYVMDKWAFYPSHVDQTAQQGGYAPDWSIENDKLYMDLPSSVTVPLANPLAVVPMVGKKDGEGKYAFTQLTGVLAFTIDGLPDGADFISLTHDDVALAGAFEVTETTNGAVIEYGKAVAKDDVGLTLHFTSAGTKATFYFSLPVGTIPAGLKLTVGKTSDTDTWMTKTTTKPVTIKRGTVMKVNVEIPYTPVDQQWEAFANAEFIDSFLWGQHTKYTTGTRVAVTMERSALHPEKYRINNPYTVANAQFGYTPYTAGIEADDYFVFTIEDGKVKYGSFLTGIEDKDSAGKPMMISYRSANASRSYVVSSLKNGNPTELLIGAMFSDPNDAGYMYSRDTADSGTNAPTIHIYITYTTPETWSDLCEVQYKDDFIFNDRLKYPSNTYITLQAQASDMYEGHYRIPNPYPLLAAQLGYSIPSYVTTTPDEYLYFNVSDDGSVTFTALHAGINLDSKDLTITHPSEISGKSVAKNIIGAFQSDGTPDYVQLAPIYHETGNTGYLYSRDGYDNIIRIVFPEVTETWTSLGTGRYMDELMWGANEFPPYDVEVEIWRSNADANRYRISNPYTVANSVFKRTAAGEGDEFMYLQINPANGQVTWGSLVTGMSKENVAVEKTKNFAIADAPTWETIKTSGSSISASDSKVISGTNANPQKIQLYSVYYDSAAVGYFYTNSTKLKYLWFPGAYRAGEQWVDYCEGTLQDGLYDSKLNKSTARLGVMPVTIQQSTVDAKHFRVTNPYRTTAVESLRVATYDDYLYFTVGSVNDLVYFEPFRPGLIMDSSPKEIGIVHPVYLNTTYPTLRDDSNTLAYSNVMSKVDSKPTKVQLAAFYFDIATPNTGYNYPRHLNQYPSERIFITFANADKAQITPKRDALKINFDNPVETITLPVTGTLEKVVIKVTGLNAEELAAARIRLYEKSSGWMTSDYLTPDAEGVVTMTEFSNAAVSSSGIDVNYKYATRPHIGASIRFLVQEIQVSGVSYPILQDTRIAHYPFAIVNYGGDKVSARGQEETVASFRIPALVTSKDGSTLIAAYDVRYENSTDLQGDIDVGYKRSTDGGNTWSDLGLAMDMGTYDFGTPEAFSDDWKTAQQNNGIGDPALLVDETTGDILCFAIWAHKHKGSRLLAYAGTGYEIDDTPQQMMVRSTDNGATWSEPVNLTRQIKKQNWRGTFQGPGRGITMKDGTLVLPYQHQEPGVVGGNSLCSGIIYSKDHGLTWHIHNYAREVTSECTVAEIEPGVLMLNMRDEKNSRRRAVYTTTDLGRSWTKHATDQTIPEPTCEASLLHVDASKNGLGQDILLFSNPNNGNSTGRSPMAIKASLDHGMTWPYVVTLTSNLGGYSCLTMIDENTVGILYEENLTNIVFQAIPLTDIIN